MTAAAHGVAVDHTPTVGAVAEWDDGTAGIGGPGHVGVVEAVGRVGDRIDWIDVSQQHIDSDADGYDWERIYRAQLAVDLGAVAESTSSTSPGGRRTRGCWACTAAGCTRCGSRWR